MQYTKIKLWMNRWQIYYPSQTRLINLHNPVTLTGTISAGGDSLSKSFKSSNSSPLSGTSDSKGGCASIDPKDESLKSKYGQKKELDQESEDQESLESSSSPEV